MNIRLNLQLFSCIACLLFQLGLARAGEQPVPNTPLAVTFGCESDFNTRYVWRGMTLSQGAVAQPTAWVSVLDFTFSGWASMGLLDPHDRGRFDEVDLTLSFSRAWRQLVVEPAVQSYVPLNQDSASVTGELSVKFAYPVGPVNLTTTHAIDVIAYRPSYYGELAIDYEHDLSSNLSIESSVGLGWGSPKFNDSYWGVSRSALNLATGEFALSYYVLDVFYIRPHVGISHLLDAALRSQTSSPTLVYGGLVLGLEF